MIYFLKHTQKLPIGINEAWDFFSSPLNLSTITPESLKFEITNELSEKMYAGQIIAYTIRPLWNIPIPWVTEITHVKELEYFIDEQRFGPYQFWHHEHRFFSIENGVEMQDMIYYKMPFGWLGRGLHVLKVKHDLHEIFFYRQKKLESLFGSY